MEIVVHDVEWVDNNDWRELGHWIHLLNDRWRKAVMVLQPIRIALTVKSAIVDPCCIETQLSEVF